MVFTSETNLLYLVFLTTSFFATSLSLLNSIGTGANLSISSLYTSDFRSATFNLRIFDDIFWVTIFWFQVCTFPSSYIVKYR